MVVKMCGARATVQKVVQLLLRRGALRPLSAFAGFRAARRPFSQRNRAAVGKLQPVFVQTTVKRKARDFRGVLQTAELFFFDREKHVVLIDERHRRAMPQSGDSEYVHGRSGGSRNSANRGFDRRTHQLFAICASSDDRQELVGRQRLQHFDRNIIFCKRRSLTRTISRIAPQRKHAKPAANLRTAERLGLRFPQRPKLARAALVTKRTIQ